jgi:hypothetical protein
MVGLMNVLMVCLRVGLRNSLVVFTMVYLTYDLVFGQMFSLMTYLEFGLVVIPMGLSIEIGLETGLAVCLLV